MQIRIVCYAKNALYLRAVNVLFLKRYLTHLDKKSHHLGEEFVDGILHVLAAEAVDCAERGSLTAAEQRIVLEALKRAGVTEEMKFDSCENQNTDSWLIL